ncbi:hypothetical protein OC845_000227 [Tilletia horrida]|nr:hypothetical protein OC845_000227 [Tilletia horrida]
MTNRQQSSGSSSSWYRSPGKQTYNSGPSQPQNGQNSRPGQHRRHQHQPQAPQLPPQDRKTPPKLPPWHQELEELSGKLATRSANFLSIQMAPYDHNPKEILEIGWSYLDPMRKHASFEAAIVTMHYIPVQNVRFTNGMLSRDNRYNFQFGGHSSDIDDSMQDGQGQVAWDSRRSVKLPLQSIIERLEETISRLVKDKRPLYIIVHGNKRGLDAIHDAGIDISSWGHTAFGTVEENDYIATDMNMDLSSLNALQQAARMAKDAKLAEEESRKYREQMDRLRYPGDYDDPRHASESQIPPLNTRFGSGSSSRNRYSTATSGNDTDTSYRTAVSSFDRGRVADGAGYNNRYQQRRASQTDEQQQQKREQKRAEKDRYGDGFDAWGQPLSDLDDSEDDLDGWRPSFAPTMRITDPDVKVIDTVTLMKALEYQWTKPNINPNAKEPEDPNVEKMVSAINLKKSPNFAGLIMLWIYDNAGNDAHYTLLSFAEMCRQHSEKMGNHTWQSPTSATSGFTAPPAAPPASDTKPTNVKSDLEGPLPASGTAQSRPAASTNVPPAPAAPHPPRGVKREMDDTQNQGGPSYQRQEPAAWVKTRPSRIGSSTTILTSPSTLPLDSTHAVSSPASALPSTPSAPSNRPIKTHDSSRKKKKKKAFNAVNTPLDILDEEYECLRQVWAGQLAPPSSVKREDPGSAASTKPCNVFVAIDIETWESDHSRTLEVGWAIHYPDKFEVDYTGAKQSIIASHFIIKENKGLRNHLYVKDQRDHFLHGSKASEKVERPKKGGGGGGECEVLSNKSCIADEADIWKRLASKLKQLYKHVDGVYLVFHDAGGDLPVLDDWDVFKGRPVLPFFDTTTRRHADAPPPQAGTGCSAQNVNEKPFWVIDTQRLMRAYQHSAQVANVQKMTDELVLDPAISNKRLHNAGNDAFYTLFGMKEMASGPELAKFRQEKQEERKKIPRATVTTAPLLSWDQEFPEEDEEVVAAKAEEHTAVHALRAEEPIIPGSQERMKPLYELMDAWQRKKCDFIAIRAVMKQNQVVELAWSILDRRAIVRYLQEHQQGPPASDPLLGLPQPRTYQTADAENIGLLPASGSRFCPAFGANQIEEEKRLVSKDALVLVNGTIASTQHRMSRQMRKVIANLRKAGGKLYLVFHGPPHEHQVPFLGIPNESLPEELQDLDARPRSAKEIQEDEKLASVELLDTALLFERFKEKADTLRDADATLLDNTNPSLAAVCEELDLLRGLEGVDLDNAGNAVHTILRAIGYLATVRPDVHINRQAAEMAGSAGGFNPASSPTGARSATMTDAEKIALIRGVFPIA